MITIPPPEPEPSSASTDWLEERLRIRVERSTPVGTRIAMEVPRIGDPELELGGRIVGPFSRYARTLPATLPFRPQASPQRLRAVTDFPDFCGWTAECPQLYRVTAEVRRRGVVEQHVERSWGASLLEIRRHNFYWEGRRWVMRAIESAVEGLGDVELIRQLDATLIRSDPRESECQAADEQGVRLVARLSLAEFDQPHQLGTRLEQLGHHPSVILVWLEKGGAETAWPIPFARPARPIVAVPLQDEATSALPPWADAGIYRLEQLERGKPRLEISQPRLVQAAFRDTDSTALRHACDRLQAAVARRGEFSGFLAIRQTE